ncbi:MAG TPA: FkbM family methyltransferase, partial [Flavisolibacter sp.]
LFVSADDNTGMTGLQKPSNFNGAIETINTITLDEWAKENHIDRINMIKIDIEGAEYEALEGMQYVLTQMKPVVMIEIQASLLAKYNKQPRDIYRFMKDHGYRSFEVVSKNQLKEIDAEWEDELVLFAPEAYGFPSHIMIQSK